jgi:pimeloyl-ACP methyl ester carboxylesterase
MFRTQSLVLFAIAARSSPARGRRRPSQLRRSVEAASGGGRLIRHERSRHDRRGLPSGDRGGRHREGESYMVGIVYVAQGAGPHPLVILLHGYPGDERNADLAQSLRRAGWDVLLFHYRGAWGSQGKFGFSNALEDVGSALAEARTASFAKRFRSDPSRVVLVGHSMGGFLAITAAAEDPAVRCVASLAGANWAFVARRRIPIAAPSSRRHSAVERTDPRRVGQEAGRGVDEERGSLRHRATRRRARDASRPFRRRFTRRRHAPDRSPRPAHGRLRSRWRNTPAASFRRRPRVLRQAHQLAHAGG